VGMTAWLHHIAPAGAPSATERPPEPPVTTPTSGRLAPPRVLDPVVWGARLIPTPRSNRAARLEI